MSFKSLVESIESSSQRIASALSKVIRDCNNIAIVYCGIMKGVAQHLFTVLKLVNPKLNIVTMNGDLFHNLLLPYISESLDLVIVYGGLRAESCILRVSTALRLIGPEKGVIISSRIAPNILSRIPMETVVIDHYAYRASMIHGNLRIGVELGSSNPRILRLKSELVLTPHLVSDIVERYRDVEASIRDGSTVIVFTESMRSVAEELAEQGYKCLDVEAARLRPPRNAVLLIYSSMEDHSVNETVLTMMREGVGRVSRFRIDTDPLSAPLYAHLFLSAVLHRG